MKGGFLYTIPDIALVALALALGSSPGLAQTGPWDIFADTQSTSVCDLINAANAELVVLSDTGQLVIVTGDDVILEDTLVDVDGSVFLATEIPGVFEPVGFIDFAEDGDGFRTLWWTSLTGRVVNVDGFTGEPTETNLFPSDFFDVPCDACNFWDDLSICGVIDDGFDDDDPGDIFDDVILDEPITFNLCGLSGQLGLAMTAFGLCVMSLTRRRSICQR